MKCWILGNGRSRKLIDLNTLQGHIIGCNAIYRDFTPNHLVVCDKDMLREITDSSYKGPVWTRPVLANRMPNTNVKALPPPPWYHLPTDPPLENWGSGMNAIFLAAHLGHEEVNLVGFDFLTQLGPQVNNVYANTQNYDPTQSQPDCDYWLRQIRFILDRSKALTIVWHGLYEPHKVVSFVKKRRFLYRNLTNLR